MSDRERRWQEQIRSAGTTLFIVGVWWTALLAVPLYFISSFATSTSQYRGLGFYPAILSTGVPILLGLPAGIAAVMHIRRLSAEVEDPGIFTVQRRANALLAVGAGLTALMPLLAFAAQ